ncbi:hypothetical protein Ocin01_01599, partial [Orchesella cincta]
MYGYTCIAVPDPDNCTAPESCKMMAKCIPNGSQYSNNSQFETYCGGNKCKPGYVCRFVKPPCLWAKPCTSHPILTCVPFPEIPTKKENKETFQYSSGGGNRPDLSCASKRCLSGTVCAMERDCTGVRYPSEQTCPTVPVCKKSIKENPEVVQDHENF